MSIPPLHGLLRQLPEQKSFVEHVQEALHEMYSLTNRYPEDDKAKGMASALGPYLMAMGSRMQGDYTNLQKELDSNAPGAAITSAIEILIHDPLKELSDQTFQSATAEVLSHFLHLLNAKEKMASIQAFFTTFQTLTKENPQLPKNFEITLNSKAFQDAWNEYTSTGNAANLNNLIGELQNTIKS